MSDKCPKCGAKLKAEQTKGWVSFKCGSFIPTKSTGIVRSEICWDNQIAALQADNDRLQAIVAKALQLAACYGNIDGGHHKMWVIDQIVRAVTGDWYAEWLAGYQDGEDGPNTYEWDEGIAP